MILSGKPVAQALCRQTLSDSELLRQQGAEVLELPGQRVYVVRGETEHLIPAVPAFILNTDAETARRSAKALCEYYGTHETGHATDAAVDRIVELLDGAKGK